MSRKLYRFYCEYCFAPETMVATPCGDMPIKDLVGTAKLLVPNAKGLGNWKEVEVRSFGQQKLLTISLRRGRSYKIIRATSDHRWLTQNGFCRTVELQSGDILTSCHCRTLNSYGSHTPHVSAIAVVQGFTFGDGCLEKNRHSPVFVPFCANKNLSLLPYFGCCRRSKFKVGDKYFWQVHDLPHSWKSLPCPNESLSFLLGWFAGYFAADGHVNPIGNQATIYSANIENIQFVRGICYQLGIRMSII